MKSDDKLQAVFDGVRSGNSWHVKGDLIDQLEFTAYGCGSPKAMMGQTLAVKPGTVVTLRMFWVNPAYPVLVGKAFPDLKDINGKRYIQEIIERANVSKSAFIRYQTYQNDSVQPSTKLVHFKAYKKWNWIICAGMFIDDIEAIIQKKQERIQQAMIQKIKLFGLHELLALMISGLISVRFLRVKLVKPIVQLTQSAEDLIVGNFGNDINIRSSREINQLADAMQRRQDSFSIACNLLKARSTESKTEQIAANQCDKNKIYEIAPNKKSMALRSAS